MKKFFTLVCLLFVITGIGTASDKYLNLEDFKSWDNSNNAVYDKRNQKVSISNQYSAIQIYFNEGFNASSYKYLKITYENASHSFNLAIKDYSNGDFAANCPKYNNTVFLSLDGLNKKSIKNIILMRMNEGDIFSVKLKSICFTQEKAMTAPEIDKSNDEIINKDISALDLVKQMKAGWCLGLTLDAHGNWLPNYSLDSEVCFGELYTTKEIIDIGMKNGFKTIRIPVTWYNHIIDDKYTIDGDWMRRVKTVVDWAIADGYYVFINTSNCIRDNMNKPLKYADGYIVRNNDVDIAESKAFLNAVWTQIATAFNNSYDEHLIFEPMNEPRNTDHEHMWQPGLKLNWCDNSKCQECLADYKILNEYNQVCLDAIRATGGNNANRFVMISSLCSGIETAQHKLFKLPDDSANNKLILVVHDYRLGVSPDLAKKTFTSQIKSEMVSDYKALNAKYISKGIPVVVGEVGATNAVPLKERIKWITEFGALSKKYGMSIVYFEAGGTGESDFSIIDRKNLCIRPEQKAFAEALTKAFE